MLSPNSASDLHFGGDLTGTQMGEALRKTRLAGHFGQQISDDDAAGADPVGVSVAVDGWGSLNRSPRPSSRWRCRRRSPCSLITSSASRTERS